MTDPSALDAPRQSLARFPPPETLNRSLRTHSSSLDEPAKFGPRTPRMHQLQQMAISLSLVPDVIVPASRSPSPETEARVVRMTQKIRDNILAGHLVDDFPRLRCTRVRGPFDEPGTLWGQTLPEEERRRYGYGREWSPLPDTEAEARQREREKIRERREAGMTCTTHASEFTSLPSVLGTSASEVSQVVPTSKASPSHHGASTVVPESILSNGSGRSRKVAFSREPQLSFAAVANERPRNGTPGSAKPVAALKASFIKPADVNSSPQKPDKPTTASEKPTDGEPSPVKSADTTPKPAKSIARSMKSKKFSTAGPRSVQEQRMKLAARTALRDEEEDRLKRGKDAVAEVVQPQPQMSVADTPTPQHEPTEKAIEHLTHVFVDEPRMDEHPRPMKKSITVANDKGAAAATPASSDTEHTKKVEANEPPVVIDLAVDSDSAARSEPSEKAKGKRKAVDNDRGSEAARKKRKVSAKQAKEDALDEDALPPAVLGQVFDGHIYSLAAENKLYSPPPRSKPSSKANPAPTDKPASTSAADAISTPLAELAAAFVEISAPVVSPQTPSASPEPESPLTKAKQRTASGTKPKQIFMSSPKSGEKPHSKSSERPASSYRTTSATPADNRHEAFSLTNDDPFLDSPFRPQAESTQRHDPYEFTIFEPQDESTQRQDKLSGQDPAGVGDPSKADRIPLPEIEHLLDTPTKRFSSPTPRTQLPATAVSSDTDKSSSPKPPTLSPDPGDPLSTSSDQSRVKLRASALAQRKKDGMLPSEDELDELVDDDDNYRHPVSQVVSPVPPAEPTLEELAAVLVEQPRRTVSALVPTVELEPASLVEEIPVASGSKVHSLPSTPQRPRTAPGAAPLTPVSVQPRSSAVRLALKEKRERERSSDDKRAEGKRSADEADLEVMASTNPPKRVRSSPTPTADPFATSGSDVARQPAVGEITPSRQDLSDIPQFSDLITQSAAKRKAERRERRMAKRMAQRADAATPRGVDGIMRPVDSDLVSSLAMHADSSPVRGRASSTECPPSPLAGRAAPTPLGAIPEDVASPVSPAKSDKTAPSASPPRSDLSQNDIQVPTKTRSQADMQTPTQLTRASTVQSLVGGTPDSNSQNAGYGQQDLLYEQFGFSGMAEASQVADVPRVKVESDAEAGAKSPIPSQDSIFRASELALSQSSSSPKLLAGPSSHPEGPLLSSGVFQGSQDPWASSQPVLPTGLGIEHDMPGVTEFLEEDVWKF